MQRVIMIFQSINPKDGTILEQYEEYSLDEIEDRLQRAQECQQIWQQTPLKERARRLEELSQLLLDRKEQLALLITQEMGKPITQSRSEIKATIPANLKVLTSLGAIITDISVPTVSTPVPALDIPRSPESKLPSHIKYRT